MCVYRTLTIDLCNKTKKKLTRQTQFISPLAHWQVATKGPKWQKTVKNGSKKPKWSKCAKLVRLVKSTTAQNGPKRLIRTIHFSENVSFCLEFCMLVSFFVTSVAFYFFFKMYLKLMLEAFQFYEMGFSSRERRFAHRKGNLKKVI